MNSFFDILKSEIKKSGWVFAILYFLTIAYILSVLVAKERLGFEPIIILFGIIIFDFLNRLVKKKSEKLFKTIIILKKIRNFYDKNPWRKGFIYPGIFFISAFFVLGVLDSLYNTPLEIIAGLYLSLAWIGSPLWVIVGYLTASESKPFTVSLITGFFIVTSFFAYFAIQGFEGAGKTAATKSIHAQTVKYISAELEYCKLGESKFMDFTQDCPATALKAINGAVASPFTIVWKNPFDTAKPSLRLSNSNTSDEDVGYTSLSASGSDIIFKTCIKTPCRKEQNRLQANISIEDTESIINADSADAVELNCKYKATDKSVNLIIDRKNQSVKYDGRNYRILYILGDNIYFRSEHNYSDVVYNYSTNNLKGIFGLSLDEIKKNMHKREYNPVFANCYIKK